MVFSGSQWRSSGAVGILYQTTCNSATGHQRARGNRAHGFWKGLALLLTCLMPQGGSTHAQVTYAHAAKLTVNPTPRPQSTPRTAVVVEVRFLQQGGKGARELQQQLLG